MTLQFQEENGCLPSAVIACVGGGSNAIGMFHPFVDDKGEATASNLGLFDSFASFASYPHTHTHARARTHGKTERQKDRKTHTHTHTHSSLSPLISGCVDVRLVGVEAGGGHGVEGGKHSASLVAGRPGVLHGTMTYLLQVRMRFVSVGISHTHTPARTQTRTRTRTRTRILS